MEVQLNKITPPMTKAQFKAAREQLGLTQGELADIWSMGKNGDRNIRRWESEKSDIPVNPIASFALGLMVKGQKRRAYI